MACKKKIELENLKDLVLNIKNGDKIFLYGTLGSGKTTLAKHIINNLLKIKNPVKSPTYVYYNKYGDNIYHFDLYRLKDYSEFISIGGEEILDNDDNICIIEWPELIEKYYKSNISIQINRTENDNEREFEIF
ncbi:MAG: tRNA (adenosine(37)-N6)-threonylcarbamoyltransferase complex ATPase subunit type 1 TsaE [Candidatus Gracilibacteria bacterium]|nr:tRNA (adenosine(37)-N6)-threonylcarbamoyltransferase complex ATPase subunit type 1 TsaE [Candidatus Gracilibacteria bacterium]MDD3120064.1 tRNA (adenosine(37)-N6)-threonylcarbamoyltransferase complex ATPase subunit type 1 TsaE [Candidatus Gracilibacteria bacterium]MDD4530235.1 tRNA (adenosine(37)-N6)-threonylcarbamoyltransferase complex ATPase subunit type 1 TsaE [Candidatus Gracilibacteria bacterium]